MSARHTLPAKPRLPHARPRRPPRRRALAPVISSQTRPPSAFSSLSLIGDKLFSAAVMSATLTREPPDAGRTLSPWRVSTLSSLPVAGRESCRGAETKAQRWAPPPLKVQVSPSGRKWGSRQGGGPGAATAREAKDGRCEAQQVHNPGHALPACGLSLHVQRSPPAGGRSAAEPTARGAPPLCPGDGLPAPC